MGKKKSMFGYIEIEEKENYRNKTPIFLERVGTKKILVFNKISFGEKKIYKYFISYFYNDHKVKPLHITLLEKALM